ncbi:hypothetical protein DLM46_12765 [Paraburkholderia lacunae]|uniref:Uncharacterized protein n=1 Tax=Paraburkholderia lacunae TaxID=2211104 RepID=A0A370NA46_9BURK|nr:hypothetical protein DLM46_12765 [Paraburkholderia lacunae]
MSVPKEHFEQKQGMSESTTHALASFWSEVKAATGNNTLGVIRMTGLLDAERSRTNPAGPLPVSATSVLGGYELGNVEPHQKGDVQQVYWLPWKNQSCEYVPMTTLTESGCRYFLTSMLTGCRFVVTETYVAHISTQS